MLNLTRRTLVGSIPTIALLAQIGRSQAAVQPAILQNDIWHKPGSRAFADRLRSELLSGAVARHCIGAHQTADTAKYPRRTCWTEEVAYDGLPPDLYVDEIRAALVSALTDDLERHCATFCRDRRIALVSLDGAMAIDMWTFQPMIRFYIEWNGVCG